MYALRRVRNAMKSLSDVNRDIHEALSGRPALLCNIRGRWPC